MSIVIFLILLRINSGHIISRENRLETGAARNLLGRREMKKYAWAISSISLAIVCSLFLQLSSHGDGRSLTQNEMRTTCGSTAGGCVLSAPLSDCNVADDPCDSCIDSMSRATLEGMSSYKVKTYLGANRKICTVPTVNNNKICDPGTVVCWTERTCDAGPIQDDKWCAEDHGPNGFCQTKPDWYCRVFTRGAPTGINKTKNDDNCI
jgi:hypothetical protein